MHAQVYFPSPIILKLSFNDRPDIPHPSYTSYCIPPVLRDWIASGPRTRRTSCSFSRRESQCWGTSELTATESSCFGQMSHGNHDPNTTPQVGTSWWGKHDDELDAQKGIPVDVPMQKRVEEWLVCLTRRYHTNWNCWSTDAFSKFIIILDPGSWLAGESASLSTLRVWFFLPLQKSLLCHTECHRMQCTVYCCRGVLSQSKAWNIPTLLLGGKESCTFQDLTDDMFLQTLMLQTKHQILDLMNLRDAVHVSHVVCRQLMACSP